VVEKVEISKRLVLINSASSILTRLLSISVLIWLQQYLLKNITAEEYSLLPVLYSIMMFAPLLTTILAGGISRYIVEAYAKEDEERVMGIVSTMFPLLCGAGLAFLVGGWIFAFYVDKVLTIAPERIWDARIMMALLMFSAAIRLPLSPFSVGLFVRQKFVLQNIIHVGTELFRLVLLFSLLFGVSTRIMWVIIASVSADLLNLLIVFVVSRRIMPVLRFRFKAIYWPIAKELINFGGWSFVASVSDAIRTNADAIILNKLGSATDITCFHVGTLATRHIHTLYITARAPLQPSVTALHAKDDTVRLQNLYIRGGRLALWASLLPAVLLMVFNREFMTLYAGERYVQAGTVMLLSLTLFPLEYGASMTTALAYGKGLIRSWALIITVMNLVNLALTFYMVGYLKMGAVGSAGATFISMGIFYPIFVYPLGLRLAGVSFTRWIRETMIPGFCPMIISAIALILLRYFVPTTTWLGLGLEASVGGGIYLLCLYLCLGKDDKWDIQRLWGKIASKIGVKSVKVDAKQ